jgi:hypothetical protein
MSQDDPILRLARHIDRTTRAEQLVANAQDVMAVRQQGAGVLYSTCEQFVALVNRRLPGPELELAPASYSGESFRDGAPNVFQIGAGGRQMQIAFGAPRELVSTEKFLIPYILEGEIRTYNQKMLERFEIRSLSIYLCIEDGRSTWRFYDWRSRRTGKVDPDLLASLMDPLFT